MMNYVLLEKVASRTATETFAAIDDETAIQRAFEALEGQAFELWRGERLVKRHGPGAPAGPTQRIQTPSET